MTDPATTTRHDIVLVGAGRVGTAVSYLLHKAGHTIAGVGFAQRASTHRAAELLHAPVFGRDDVPPADVVLLGVPADAIAAVARDLAARIRPGVKVVHFAGAWGIELLHPVHERGAGVCALHPVQACPDVDAAIRRLPGSAWGVTCSEGLEDWAAGLIEIDLDGSPTFVEERDRAVWHAATVTTANGIAALLAGAEDMLRAIGIEDPIDVLGPLAAGAVANARDGGGGVATLTGPAVRGERDAIERHLLALSKTAPDSTGAYVAATRAILTEASRAGRIDPAVSAAMASLLSTT
jgi:predicted short-subunit dehydrogenase-like oxidoreductase (DUF2520 family)